MEYDFWHFKHIHWHLWHLTFSSVWHCSMQTILSISHCILTFLFRTSLCYKSLSLGVIFPSCSIKYNYKASASYSDYDHFTGTGFIFYNHFNSGYTNVIIKFQTFTNIFLACSKDFIILIIQGISSIIDDT